MDNLKLRLYALCENFVGERITAAKHALDDAQQASIDDTKSSAGDKYETGREMMKQELDRNMAQLNEANKLKIALQQIAPGIKSNTATEGSLITTDNGAFYLSVSAGKLQLDNDIYFAVSAFSPIGLKLKGLKAGDSFTLNGKNYAILSII